MDKTSFSSRIVIALTALIAAFGLTFALSGCTSQNVDMSTVTAVIDVRTPGEYASGHLDGAVNIDWEGSDFAGQVAELDKNGVYVLYCRSGNRAGQALDAMTQMGFTHVTNAGGVDNASTLTGLAIVQ